MPAVGPCEEHRGSSAVYRAHAKNVAAEAAPTGRRSYMNYGRLRIKDSVGAGRGRA